MGLIPTAAAYHLHSGRRLLCTRALVLSPLALMAAKFGKVSNSKLVLLGDSAVGKSSVVERFVKNEFFQYQVRVPKTVASCRGSGPRGAVVGSASCDRVPRATRESFDPDVGSFPYSVI